MAPRLAAMNPRAVLGRGYAVIIRPGTGEVVQDSIQVAEGEDVSVRLHRGGLVCRVMGTSAEEET